MRQVTRKGLITMAAASGVIAMGSGAAHADSAAGGGASNSPGVLSGNAVQVPVHVPVNACGNTVNVVGALNPAFADHCANQGGGHRSGGAAARGHASQSPGVGSGNHIQAPIDVPLNLCGNGVNVVGVGNPVFGNDCVNDESGHPGHPQHPGHPAHPGHPQHPGRPGQHQPQHPGKPHHPGTPHHPGHPGQHQPPCNPGQPGHPGQPEHPGHPGQHQPQHPGQHQPQYPGVPQHPVSPVAHQPGKHARPTAPAQGGAPVAPAVTAPHAPAAALATTGSDGMGFAVPAAAGLLLGGAVLYRRGRAAQ
ncbi:IgA FC receptor [Streptomyces hundungensis]|uniref:IgA FC receptor n=1 Tax=Streptomyces hundungensis TaxID=1077946 RepID=A0A387HRV6_9ACTN|nr:chaplin [Streptomyces hundungensis]AYG83867.1 IgA FC receptor [Streptomyces hundungensis]